MKNFKTLLIGIFTFSFALLGCKEDDEDNTPPIDQPGMETLEVDINGLKDLGPENAYEGWLMVDGSPISAGVFTVNGNGEMSQTSFQLDEEDVANATAYILTVEPSPDTDPSPSNIHLLAGDFNGNDASLSVGHESTLGDDLMSISGSYILATPTNGDNSNEKSGVWWLEPGIIPGTQSASLNIPELPSGWTYEGWAVIDGIPVSTGTFNDASGQDGSSQYSGTMSAPEFPGEDFLMNAPSGLSFPVNLEGNMIVVSIEPVPDNEDAPFLLKPLTATVPMSANDHESYDMNNNAANTNPTGTASR